MLAQQKTNGRKEEAKQLNRNSPCILMIFCTESSLLHSNGQRTATGRTVPGSPGTELPRKLKQILDLVLLASTGSTASFPNTQVRFSVVLALNLMMLSLTKNIRLRITVWERIRNWRGCGRSRKWPNLRCQLITNSTTELSTTREVTTCNANNMFPSNLCNPKVHHQNKKALHLSHPVPDESSQYTSNPISPWYIIILSTDLLLGLSSGLFPSGFFPPITYTCSSLSPFVLHAHPFDPPRLDHSNYTWRRV
jgi:hypothetical protein